MNKEEAMQRLGNHFQRKFDNAHRRVDTYPFLGEITVTELRAPYNRTIIKVKKVFPFVYSLEMKEGATNSDKLYFFIKKDDLKLLAY